MVTHKNLPIILRAGLLLALSLRLEAQVSYQYDTAGNLTTQSAGVAGTPPVFQEFGPQYLGANPNGLLTLSVPVTGVGPFTYQWLFNGVVIPGATNGSFLLTNAMAGNLGKYQLVAINGGGAVTSIVLNVSFFDPDGSGLPMAWELAYFHTTGVDPSADPDSDGVSNYQEYLDGTDPTTPFSVMPRLYIPDFIPRGSVRVVPLKAKYQLGDVVHITPLPDPGGFFEGWSGSSASPEAGSFSSADSDLTLVMNSTTWLTAEFYLSVVAWGYNDRGETNVPTSLSNVVAIAGGQFFSLAVQGDGTVTAWGDNSYGQIDVPVGLSNAVAVAGGYYFSLALQSNGMVMGWGEDRYGETNVPVDVSNAVAIAAGGYFGMALESNGTVAAWGDNSYGEIDIPAGVSNAVAIAAGLYHGLAALDNGTVVAWGDNTYGETNVPAGLSNVVAVSAGYNFSVALQSSGTVVAWGLANYGQTNVPADLSNVVAIAAGSGFTQALKRDGSVESWGNPGYGETTVPPGLSNVAVIAAGSYHGMALINDGLPSITRQPIAGAAYSGTSVLLNASVAGAPPLSYQWRLNGVNLVGATNAMLLLTNLQTANSGSYSVVVSNSLGTATDTDETLSVNNVAPIILDQPVSQTFLSGGSASLTVSASGSLPLNYQWQLNGTNVSGATLATLNLASVTLADLGTYRVQVGNAYGMTLSSNAILAQALTLVTAWGYNEYGQTNVPAELANVVEVAGGIDSSLALESDGTVVAWGYDPYGEVSVPTGLSNVTSIAAGGYFALALQSNGSVVGWGDDGYGETTLPPGVSNVAAVAAGEYHGLALESNGTVMAWGYNGYDQTNVPAGLSNVVAIAAGGHSSLALRDNGTVVGWGYDIYGESSSPPGLSNVVAIAEGLYHSLALQGDGTVVAWGYNGYGETNVPAGLSNVVSIAAGDYFSLALQNNGKVVGWGESGYGLTTPPAGLSNVVAIGAGDDHVIAVRNDGSPFITRQPFTGNSYSGSTVVLSVGVTAGSQLSYQWKLNGTNLIGATNAQLTLNNVQTTGSGAYSVVVSNSFGTASSAGTTLAVSNSTPIILVQPVGLTVPLGENAAFAVAAAGSLPLSYQWQFQGANIAGATKAAFDLANVAPTNFGDYRVKVSNAFGTATSSNATLAQSLTSVVGWGYDSLGQTNVPSGLRDAVAIAGANHSSLALERSGMVVAWGDDTYGQTNPPAGLSGVEAIADGGYFGLALRTNGTVAAWGDDIYGETNVPVGLSNVVAIAAGLAHGLALESNGIVVAWGYNGYGQTSVPADLSNVVAIAAGGYFSMALQDNGTVVAWGDYSYGATNPPSGLSNVVAIAGGIYHGLALKDDGTVVGWGYDGDGETNVPVGLSNVVAIAAGGYFNLALQNNGTVVAWGDDTYGEANLPSGLSNVVAIAAGQYHALAIFNDGSPFITRQPTGVNTYSGATVVLSAGAAGASPLSYQWKFNGTNLIGATNALLTLTNVQTTRAGVYNVVVSNSLGTTNSSDTTLTVENSAPILLNQPSGQTVFLGGNAGFEVSSIGSTPLNYQWQFNGASIAGATSATLNLSNVTLANIGTYRLEVSNAFGTTISSNAALTGVRTLVVAWGGDFEGQTNVPPGLGTVVAIAAENESSLALQSDGTVVAWGDNTYGETNVPAGLSNVVAIGGGGYFGLALQHNGTVVAWGNNGYGQTTLPPGLSNVIGIAAGFYHGLALESNGTVTAWGYNGNGQTTVPAGLSNVVSIAAGGYFSLALQANGTLVAWGDDTYGETNLPAGLSDVVAISAGIYNGMALENNGTVVGWGYDGYGETNTPAGLSNAMGIASCYEFSLAIQSNSTVVGWGLDNYGQTAIPAGLSNVVAIAGGGYHGLALLHDGSPFISQQQVSETASSGTTVILSVGTLGTPPLSYQWEFNGTNLVGATNALLTVTNVQAARAGIYTVAVSNSLGTASSSGTTLTVTNTAPTILVQPASVAAILGDNVGFSVPTSGSLPQIYQWQFNGTNIAGATQATLDLANVTPANVGSYRVNVSNAFGTAISSNASLEAALSLVVAWGDNSNGQANVPSGLGAVVAVAGDGYSSLALRRNGTVAAWGDDSFGEATVPSDLSNVAALAAGLYHNLALESNGTVVAWGNNYDGQANVPVGLGNVSAVAAGFLHSLALQSNGTVMAWGDDYYGQTDVPTGLSNVAAIAAGGNFSLALQNNGTVVAWGDDSSGQTNVPPGLNKVVAIAAGDYFSVALEDNGRVVAWGDDSHGQTDVPFGLNNVVAVAADGYFSLALQDNGTVMAWGDSTHGQTNVPPGLSNVMAIAAGGYHALAVFNNGSPFIARQPLNTLAYSGGTALLSAGATGASPLSYQWKLNGTNLIGATNAALILTNLQTTGSGLYSLFVSNAVGTANSADVTLTVAESAPIILVQPGSQAVPAGASTGFAAAATGSLPLLGGQWQFNGASIAGATNFALILTNVSAANVGNYRVVVSNAFGTTFSSNASLNLTPANDMFANRIIFTGYSNTLTGSNIFATKEIGEPNHADNAGGSSVWWSWIAPANGAATVSTLGSSFDTLLGVYTGSSVSSLSLVASDDDYGGLLTSLVTFDATAGTKYQIAVDGFDGATGNIVLNVQSSAKSGGTLALAVQNPFLSNGVTLTFTGPPSNYRIQGSSNLVSWITLTNVDITNSPFQFHDPGATNYPVRFYRTVTP